MSLQHNWKAWYVDITHVCGLYLHSIGQIDGEGGRSKPPVSYVSALHYKNGGSTGVSNCLVWRNLDFTVCL